MNRQIHSLTANAILNGITQICKIVFPLITFSYSAHILGAENIGILQFSASIVGYFSLLASLGINTYAVREGTAYRDNRQQFNNYSSQIFSINIISTVISYALLSILVIKVDRLNNYSIYIIIQSLTILFTTLGADWINTIYEDYLYLTLRYIIVESVSVVLMLVLVRQRNDLIIYAIIRVIAASGGNILNFFYLKKYANLKFTFHIDYKKHIRPILILFAYEITVTIFVNSDITILGLYKDDREVGIYSTASNIYNIVKRLVYSFVTVALPRFSYLVSNNKDKEIKQLYERITNIMLIIALPACVGVFCSSRNLIAVLAGDEFITGYSALCILSPAIIVVAFSNIFCLCALIPHKEDTTVFLSSLIAALTNIVLNFILIPYWGGNAAAFTTLLSETLVFILYLIKSKKYNSVNFEKNNVISTVLGCVGIVLSCMLINHLRFNILISLILEVLLSIFVYTFLLILLQNKYILEIIDSVNKKFRRKKFETK